MTLEALTIDLPNNGDSPELAAFKQKVRQVGDKYARRRRVTEEIYQELGVPENVSPVTVTLTVTQGYAIPVKVSPYLLVGKSAQEQAEVLLDDIDHAISVSAKGRMLGSITLTVDDVVSMSMSSGPITPGYMWLYIRRGRVQHAFREDDDGTYGLYSACSRVLRYRDNLFEESATGTGTRCKTCSKELGVTV